MSDSPRRIDPWLLAAVGVALALRAALLFTYSDVEGRADETLHYIIGVLVSHFGTDAIARWAPLYELFQAAVYASIAPETWAVKAVQVVISSATVVLVYLLAGRIGGRRAARIAAFVLALYPTHVVYSAWLYNETLYLFLLTTSAWFFLRRPDLPTRGDALLSGVFFGLAGLTRSVLLNFLPVWLLWTLLRGRRQEAGRVALVIAAALLVIAPWTLRNFEKYDRFVLVDPIVGHSFYYAFNHRPIVRDIGFKQRWISERPRCRAPLLQDPTPLPPAEELYALFPPSAERFLATPERLRHQIQTLRVEATIDMPAWSSCELERGIDYWIEHPVQIVGHWFVKFYALWGPNSLLLRYVYQGVYPDGPLAEESYPLWKWVIVLSTVAVFVLGFLSYGLPRTDRAAEWIALFAFYYTGVHVLASAFSRYRLPIAVFAIVLAAVFAAKPRAPAPGWRRLVVAALLVVYLGMAVPYLLLTLP